MVLGVAKSPFQQELKEVGEICCELQPEGKNCCDHHYNGHIISNFLYIDVTTLGAGEEIYEVAGIASGVDIDRIGKDGGVDCR